MWHSGNLILIFKSDFNLNLSPVGPAWHSGNLILIFKSDFDLNLSPVGPAWHSGNLTASEGRNCSRLGGFGGSLATRLHKVNE